MISTLRRPVAASVLLALMAGATPVAAQIETIGPKTETKAIGAKPAKTLKALRLGIVAASRVGPALERVEPFRRRLAATLEEGATVVTFDNEAELVRALAAERIDYAPLTASGFATASVLCGCVEPLAAPRAADRSAGWYAVVVTRPDGPIVKAEDLAGRTMALTGDEAVGTRRLPLMMLAKSGLTGAKAPRLIGEADPKAALRSLLAGRVEAALIWSSLEGEKDEGWTRGPLRDLVAAGEVRHEDVRIVWTSPILPHGPHAVRSAIDEGRKRRLREMLIELDTDPEAYEAIEPVHSGGFVRVGAPAYAPFTEMVTPRAEPSEPTRPDGATPPG